MASDLDLAAIKARYEVACRDELNVDPFGPAWESAADVPALLARIAELEAERDEVDDYAGQLTDIIERCGCKPCLTALSEAAAKESTDG